MNIMHLVKVGMAWVSVVYVICYAGVALFPGVRPLFMKWSLHSNMPMGESVLTLGTFVVGFILWNVIAALAFGLFGFLFNRIK